MTREQLYKIWIKQEYDSKGIDRNSFFKDLDNYFDSELIRNTEEMQRMLKDKTIYKQFIRLVFRFLKGESLKDLEKEFGDKND